MASKGGSRHFTRITADTAVPVTGRKDKKWLTNPRPGRHGKKTGLSLVSFLRDVLRIAGNYAEAKQIVKSGNVFVDGKRVKEEKFAVGLMDVVNLKVEGKSYRLVTNSSGVLASIEVEGSDASKKYCKVVNKHTAPKGRTIITLHDGRTFLGDNNYKVGDSVVFDFSSQKPSTTLKLQPGSSCLVTEGKHAGAMAQLVSITERKGSMDPEAKLHNSAGEFTTLRKYLFVVDTGFKVPE